MTLADAIAVHEAATARYSLPSTTYRSGPLLAPERWTTHGRKNPGSRTSRHCHQMARLTTTYPTAFEIIATGTTP